VGRVFGGLEAGDGAGFGCWRLFFLALHHAFQQEADDAFALFGPVDFGWWRQGAKLGVGGGLFDQFGSGPGGLRFGEVEAGDLEAVEEEAGAARVDVVGGDALEDLADGVLDGGAVFGERNLEGGAAAAAGAWVLSRFAGVVVVVAEIFSAEAWASAAVAVGEDVAALIAFGCFGLW